MEFHEAVANVENVPLPMAAAYHTAHSPSQKCRPTTAAVDFTWGESPPSALLAAVRFGSFGFAIVVSYFNACELVGVLRHDSLRR